MTCVNARCYQPKACAIAARCCDTPTAAAYACSYGMACQGQNCRHEDCPRKRAGAPQMMYCAACDRFEDDQDALERDACLRCNGSLCRPDDDHPDYPVEDDAPVQRS